MNKARDQALGSRKDRRRAAATRQKDGSYKGGVAFERHMRAKPVYHGGRAYTLSASLQKRKQAVSPASTSKLMGEPDEHLIMRNSLLKVRVNFSCYLTQNHNFVCRHLQL